MPKQKVDPSYTTTTEGGTAKPKVDLPFPEPIVVPAEEEHTATIFFLHGFNSR
jgi:hypothetical protein